LKTPLFASFVLASALVGAQSQTFKIGGGSPAMQSFTVDSTADFEDFTGTTNAITGTIIFDPAKKTGSGKLAIDVSTIKTGIDLRDEHMRSEMWLDTAKYRYATFESTRVQHLNGNNYRVTGNLTLKGVTKTITTNATVRFIKESDQTRAARFKGDLVNLKTEFKIRLSDYNIKIPAQAKGKVGEVVTIKLSVFGTNG
jgi:polyisoprenoid-binding protein YceI